MDANWMEEYLVQAAPGFCKTLSSFTSMNQRQMARTTPVAKMASHRYLSNGFRKSQISVSKFSDMRIIRPPSQDGKLVLIPERNKKGVG